ncbi:MAG: transglycosylase domain-containing protein [Bdellovibrionales bacterium]|nr:transglycosylase domain-containing protein [Bdellovibrionales bacterium]
MLKKIAPLAWFGLILLSIVTIATTAFALFLLLTPNGKDLEGCLTTSMFQVDLCPKKPSYVKIGQISPFLKNAIVVSEDAAFWDHHGIDWVELQNSFETNLKKGRMARGEAPSRNSSPRTSTLALTNP